MVWGCQPGVCRLGGWEGSWSCVACLEMLSRGLRPVLCGDTENSRLLDGMSNNLAAQLFSVFLRDECFGSQGSPVCNFADSVLQRTHLVRLHFVAFSDASLVCQVWPLLRCLCEVTCAVCEAELLLQLCVINSRVWLAGRGRCFMLRENMLVQGCVSVGVAGLPSWRVSAGCCMSNGRAVDPRFQKFVW